MQYAVLGGGGGGESMLDEEHRGSRKRFKKIVDHFVLGVNVHIWLLSPETIQNCKIKTVLKSLMS